jgi:hypothetical protein
MYVYMVRLSLFAQTYYMTKETYYMTKETYYMTKETYYMTKETSTKMDVCARAPPV